MTSEKKNTHFEAAYSLESADQTRAHYKNWAQTYDQEIGEDNQYAQPARVAAMLLRFTKPENTKILDAGCGSGLSGVALKDAGFSDIEGCDFSPQMLAKAEEKNVYRKLFNADLNGSLTEFGDNIYDAIVIVGVFSFGHVAPDACDELVRILKPGGFLIVAVNEQFWNEGSLQKKLANLEESGKALIRCTKFGDHLPGHAINGWVIALEKR